MSLLDLMTKEFEIHYLNVIKTSARNPTTVQATQRLWTAFEKKIRTN